MRKSTLKFALIGILLIFAIAPVLILGAVGTFSVIGYSNDVRMNELSTVSASKAGAVETIMSDFIADATALSKMDTVVRNAQNSDSSARDTIDAFTESNAGIYDTLIVDTNGNVLISSKGVESGSFEHFNADGMPVVSGLVSWEKYGFDAMYVCREIYANPDNKTGGKLGYVCLIVSPESDSTLMKALSGTYLETNAYFALIDSDGNMLNFGGSGSANKSGSVDGALTAQKDDLFNRTQNVAASATGGSTGATVSVTGTAGKYAYACGVIPNVTNWRWIGIADTSSFTNFAFKTNIIGWVAIVIMVVLAAVVAMVVIGRFIGGMQTMLKTMSNINTDEGISSLRFDIKKGKSELEMIQASFNDFLDEVYINGERYRTIAELSDNMLFEWDFHKETMYVSDNTLQKFDLNTDGATLSNGKFLDSLMEPEFAEKYKRDINTLLKNQSGYSTEYQLRSKSGASVWVSFRATCITDRVGEPLRVIGVMTDIDNEKKMELQLSERASYDFLSQLYNRSTFLRMLSSELDRRGPKKIGIMFIDVDDFKFINDRYGHTIGDEVIRFVADTIRKKVDDKGGIAGRFGGDEFVLCYTDQADVANLEQIAMDIIDELYLGYTTADGMLINVRASIGISYCPDHTEDVNELISFADTAMYFVKKNGKTNYHVYVPEDSASGEYIDPEGY
ncbi:MAG: diguanylate cyclase [Lachnospiraceae bacterium]|nr:diguanylate cyclase [Ruminococcus sp.]MCM1274242.1 diguanylate cyclase [Lachnospiraceae bacterium]